MIKHKRSFFFVLLMAATLTAPPVVSAASDADRGPGISQITGIHTENQGNASQGQPRLIPDNTSNNYAGSKAEPIFKVKTDQPYVALTFDSDWENQYTNQILEILDRYGLTCTFFLTARWMETYPEDVKNIYDHGHEIGNHSTDHPEFTSLTPAQMDQQIQYPHQLIKERFGIEMCLFRAPFGDYNNQVIDAVKRNGYYSIQWTIDSLDWKNLGKQDIIDRILNSGKLDHGAIILMHNGAQYTPSALEEVIQGILAKGYQIVPVSSIIYENNYHMDYTGLQIPNER